MAEQVRVSNWPDTGSPEEVAFKLWSALRHTSDGADQQLAFYAKCRRAARGIGEFKPPA